MGLVIIAFVFGLLLGSFANVCIWRIPREISIIRPGSFCTSCMKPVAFYHNIPVLSWIILKGKCVHCSESFSVRYPVIEFLAGSVTALWFYSFGLSPTAFIFTLFGLALIVISMIDIDYRIIAPQISYPLMLSGLLLAPYNELISSPGFGGVLESGTGLLIGGGIIWLVRFLGSKAFGKEAMGLGDVKLMMGIGAFTGAGGIFWTIFAASLLGSIAGIILKIFGNIEKYSYIPFGPFLAAGAVIYIHLGEYLDRFWYMGTTL